MSISIREWNEELLSSAYAPRIKWTRGLESAEKKLLFLLLIAIAIAFVFRLRVHELQNTVECGVWSVERGPWSSWFPLVSENVVSIVALRVYRQSCTILKTIPRVLNNVYMWISRLYIYKNDECRTYIICKNFAFNAHISHIFLSGI